MIDHYAHAEALLDMATERDDLDVRVRELLISIARMRLDLAVAPHRPPTWQERSIVDYGTPRIDPSGRPQ